MTAPANREDSSAPKHYSPNDLTKFIIPDRVLMATGGFGSVYRCIYMRENEPVDVAVKAINRNTDVKEDALRREIGIWKRMRHDHIVPFFGTTTHITSPCYFPVSCVSLWMPNGSLKSYLNLRPLALEEKYKLLRDVADGLHYLHSESVVHGDLTNTNVLINEKGQACLTDFGLSSMIKIGSRYEYLQNEKTSGAVRWSAPELLPDFYGSQDTEIGGRNVPSTPSDIYSYGCIMYEVLSGDIPWGSKSDMTVLQFKQKGKTPSSEGIQDEDWIFILQCWLSLPSLRPFASQALKFAQTRHLSVSKDQPCETSDRASIYSVHLDGANIYNLSSLVRSHQPPAFSDPAICWKSIDNLAEALIKLSTANKSQHGLMDAIQLYHVSLATLKPGSTFVSSSLRKISSAITLIGTEQGDIEAIHTEQGDIQAIERITENDHPLQFTCLSYLSLHRIAEYIINPDPDMTKNWKSFNSAAGDVLCRLQIALAYARIFEKVEQAELSLEAYETSLQLLQQHVSATDGSWAEPVERLATSLAVDAAAAALRLMKVNKAVELLEWGRELLWAYIVRSRTSKGEEKQTSEADRKSLSRPSLSDLLEATQDHPVVVLIASRRSCDAIIVSNAHPQALHIPLKIALSDLAKLSTTFKDCTSYASRGCESVEDELKGVLQSLWVNVVSPVIDRLKNVRPNSRIWWYPTSVFSTLPIHAAGEYTSEGKELSTLYVSSYTSSISSLLRARTCNDHSQSSEFRVIYQVKSVQNDEQRDVEDAGCDLSEMVVDFVKRSLPGSLSFTRFANATKEDAEEAFEKCGWFHLIASATQNACQPLNSSFLMRDGSLSIPDILSVDHSPKEFAFLSARPADPRFSWMQNEVIQFAAGMQISGFKSVVGTMGDVDDSKAWKIIYKFYKAFFRPDTPDCTRAAQALHDALKDATKDGIPLRQRIAFAHFGL